jgi:hypothetical protein
MADPEPTAEAMTGLDAAPTSWARARELLENMRPTYWLATVRPDGRPHVMLASNSSCVVAVEEEPLDLVVEGEAVKTRDEATLRRVADAYAAVYDWHVTVRDGAFHDTEGAPTAGPPPYDVYEVTPAIAFGYGTDETLTPTRWRF